ncbi:hypothetical protein JCM14036_09890 [Desulfotomaculum defluvii]
MIKVTLKKIISKSGFKEFITNTEKILGSPICIKDTRGKFLFGSSDSLPYEYAVKCNDSIVGSICGEKRVYIIADLLSFWITIEYEKKALGQELLEKYREVNFYFNVTEQLASNPEPLEVARFLIEESKRLIKYGDISIILIEDEGKKVLSSSQNEDYSLEVAKTCRLIIDSTLNNNKGEVINNFPSDKRYIEEKIKVNSLMCAPLAIKDKVLGVIIVSSRESADYSAGDLKLLSTLAYQIAAAIENARLFAKLKETIEDLKDKQDELSKSIKTRMEFGNIFISVVLMVSLYTLLITLLNNTDVGAKEMYAISRAIEIAFVLTNVWLVFRSKLPLESFGITTKNTKKSIIESLIISAVLMAALAGLKVYLVNNLPSFQGEPVMSWRYVGWDYLTYIIVAPLQEFLCRGILQNSIQRFLVGPLNWLWAIVLTSSLFGVFHIHESIELGIAAILGGLLWGWMFVRHKTLVGVSINHFLIGNWLGVLGLWNIITHT